jgi:putative nucleotidyltransferase with HDIG domain
MFMDVFERIWELAKPFYEKGRHYDIPHIEWMMKEAVRIADVEGLDKQLLLPICILHDVGYSTLDNKNPNVKSEDVKRQHMAEGAKIAQQILEEVEYKPELTKKIVHYISVHDNWLLGDDSPFQECKEMALFNDLDFLWAQSSWDVFTAQAKSMGKEPKEMYTFWLHDEKLQRRPFCCEETKKMFSEFMAARKKESDGKN